MSADRVHDLVPFVHVADPERSIAFYEQLGLEVINSLTAGSRIVWAFLRAGHACLMVAQADGPVDAGAQAVLLYLYTDDLDALRGQLQANGVAVGDIHHPEHMPEGELRMDDPDGYCLLIGQLADPSHRA
jgi:predicted enzyme related to lactoylglutathione lyase